jgi:hypothetical protein
MTKCNKCDKEADIFCLGCGGFACNNCHDKARDLILAKILNTGFTKLYTDDPRPVDSVDISG